MTKGLHDPGLPPVTTSEGPKVRLILTITLTLSDKLLHAKGTGNIGGE